MSGTRGPWRAFPRVMCVGALVLFLISVPSVNPGWAQGVSYTTVTKGEFGGGLGTILQLVPGAQDEQRETVFLRPPLMRTDADETSTIVNAEEGRFTVLQHPDKTFFSYTLEEMMASFSAQMAGAEAQRAEAEAQKEEMQEEEEEPAWEVQLSSERTGRTMDVGGYSAEQFLMVMKVVPKTEEARTEAADSGSMAVLTELWVSSDFPGWEELKKAQMEMAEQAMGSQQAGGLADAMRQAFDSDPRMKEAFDANLEALQEMDGMAVKTITSFVVVPPGKELDTEQVLAMADQPISAGVGGVVADAAADAAKREAEQAARGAVSNLTRGILGRRRQQEEPEETQPEPTQAILMRVTSTVQDILAGPLSDDLFQPRPDYQEKDPPWKGTGGTG